MKQVIECVPNFSEGRDMKIILAIAAAIASITGVKLLNIDPGKATNRTVITFAGEPGAVVEAAFEAIKKAAELIDMSKHTGEHPRMGATDVCPLIPVSNIKMEEVAGYAKLLAARVGDELNIPVYLYEHSQADKERNNLSIIRAGEYEGFFDKIKLPGWVPYHGPEEHNIKSGATVIGARDFLIAYNINLDTRDVAIANEIAAEVRESGRVIKTEKGKTKRIPGTLKFVKAIGWYIEEYGVAQVSMNLTNIEATPIYRVFDEVVEIAAQKGIKVNGSELIGMIPLKAMVDAGKHFAAKQDLNIDLDEADLIAIAVKSMGLAELGDFDPQKKIIEYLL